MLSVTSRPVVVEEDLLGGHEAEPLDVAPLDLADVDGRVGRLAGVVEDVGAEDGELAGQDVDLDLRDRERVGEVGEELAVGEVVRRLLVVRGLVESRRRSG